MCQNATLWLPSLFQSRLLDSQFGSQYGDIVTSERLIFGDFMVPGADPKVYSQARRGRGRRHRVRLAPQGKDGV